MLLILLLLAVIGFVLIFWFGWKAKTNADMILYQAMPFTFFSVMFIVYALSQVFVPGEIEFVGFVLLFIVPLTFFATVITTVLGIKGLIAWRKTDDNFMLAVSLLSVITIFTGIFMCFLSPILFSYMLFQKWSNRN